MFKLISVLFKIKLLSPLGLFRLIFAIYKYGINVMMLLKVAESTYGNKIALVDDNETISYKQLLAQSEKLSIILKQKYQVKSDQKVGFLCKNHASLIKSIFATSLIGSDVYLLNTEMSKRQLDFLFKQHDFDLLIYDDELCSLVDQLSFSKNKVLSYHEHLPAINNLLHINSTGNQKIQRTSLSKIMLLTGGTTGISKQVAHKPSLFNYLNPFLTLLTKLKLLHYQSAYIATPIYHGYGIAVLFLFIILGKKLVISNGFEAEKACTLIRNHQVEVVTVVPLMIHKMLQNNAEDLKSLACIASGGAELNPKLAREVMNQLGDVLYNLYGTSEAGLNIIATPQDLRYSINTIGRKIEGVQLRVLDNKLRVKDGKIGRFCIKSRWSMTNRSSPWIESGDLGYRDKNGYYFLCGRTDDMVVSAGVNVYPIELEQILIEHPQIEDVAVIGIRDEDFGSRLKAFVHPVMNAELSHEELFAWLRPRVARFQVPKEIVFIENMPYTSVGKRDKKQLI